MNRNEILSALKENPNVSVLIVGAGINGIGVFRDLSLNGVDVLLIDRADFCSGASRHHSAQLVLQGRVICSADRARCGVIHPVDVRSRIAPVAGSVLNRWLRSPGAIDSRCIAGSCLRPDWEEVRPRASRTSRE